ncbi:hypothetical protein TSUD_414140 [Trifolium subterraneum]|uniref:Retrotransposon Copia-like N-terminal domain-containing protein n=1 Tax=Trifolium subterraneum TaxID=3900 RepID=A0A2Z6P547_TRISU|nr:hypothetical protein TSUD_414140 [Trifolium subterraneum]
MENPFNTEGAFTSSQTKITNLISVRLDDKNFKQWKQQVSSVIRGFSLQKYINNPVVPEQFLSDADRTAGTVNPLYQAWENQDALVCTWLLSTILDSLLAKVVDYTYSSEVWDEIHRHFETLLNTKARLKENKLLTITNCLSITNKKHRMITNKNLQSITSTTIAAPPLSPHEQEPSTFGASRSWMKNEGT